MAPHIVPLCFSERPGARVGADGRDRAHRPHQRLHQFHPEHVRPVRLQGPVMESV